MDALSDRTCRCRRHVARALYDSGHQSLSRFPGLILGRLYTDLLGLGDIFWNHWAFHGSISFSHSSFPSDRDCGNEGSSKPRATGAQTWLIRPAMASWPNSKRRKPLLMRSSARAAMVIARSMPLRH